MATSFNIFLWIIVIGAGLEIGWHEGYFSKMNKFTTNQFVAIIGINLFFLLLFAMHFLSETVRTNTIHDTVYKDKIVKSCDAATVYTQEMAKAIEMCGSNNNQQGVQTFKVDNDQKPNVTCKF